MQPRCKKCGRPLQSVESIIRGMGPECAGIASTRGKPVRVQKHNGSGFTYGAIGNSQRTSPLSTWIEDERRQTPIPEPLLLFPPDLLGLVLSAPATGSIAACLKSYKCKKIGLNATSPIVAIKEIRRACIDLRMLFWPGFFSKGKPLSCIPSGDTNWRIGQNGREISVNDLVSYLSRYGVI